MFSPFTFSPYFKIPIKIHVNTGKNKEMIKTFFVNDFRHNLKYKNNIKQEEKVTKGKNVMTLGKNFCH